MSEQPLDQNNQSVNYGKTLVNVFADPQVAFEDIKKKPNWIVPIILILIVSYIFNVLTLDIQFKTEKEYILDSSLMTEDQKDEYLEQMETPSFYKTTISPIVTSVLTTFLIPLIIATVFLIFGNFIFGGSASFLLNFCAVAWAGLIGLLEGIIKLPIILNKGTLEVYTSLALFMDSSLSKTFFSQFLNIFDVFTVWKVIVYSIAFMVVYKFSKTRSYATMITLTLVISFIGIGLAQLL